MRKLLAIAAVAVVMTGCEKSSPDVADFNENLQVITKTERPVTAKRIFTKKGAQGDCLSNMEMNCAGWEVVIKPETNAHQVYSKLITMIDPSESGSINNDNVRNFFKENKEILEEYIHEYYIDGVINLKFTVDYAKGTLTEAHHIIFLNTNIFENERIDFVYPVYL